MSRAEEGFIWRSWGGRRQDFENEWEVKMPSHAIEREGITSYYQRTRKIPLLLVVYRRVLDFLALRIGSRGADRAGLAIGGHDDFTGDRSLPILLSG